MRIYSHRCDQVRKLAVHDGRDFIAFDYDDLGQKAPLESIFYGRAQKVTPHFAHINIGLDRPGILNKPEHIKEGDGFFVQIKREAFVDKGEVGKGLLKKGAQLTKTITLITPYFMYFPHQKGISFSSSIKIDSTVHLEEMGRRFQKEHAGKIIFRSKALDVDESILWKALIDCAHHWKMITEKQTVGMKHKGRSQLKKLLDTYADSDVYTDHIDDFKEVSSTLDMFPSPETKVHYTQEDVFHAFGVYEAWSDIVETPWIKLPCGGQLLMEATSTLLSIDVNQGTSTSLKQLNTEAAARIPELIQQLHLGGNIIIDFAGDLNPSNKAALIQSIKKHLLKDVSSCTWSALGWLELRRPKTRPSLFEKFCV